ncbi:hypothetical protein M3212_09905 [Alkalihalobacillus oceani]|uniref:hypothetical protein n=1 Tax=Halalkalibacter oceani TaxID=1653776 RepID=UPI00203DE384|nr:hypothetical protein [Halalkalibacter oceani]MCM3761095.1 hypothetical protein [Halalkalibacter oceani]
MGKKKRKNKKRINEETDNFGTCVLYCKDCNYEFELEWDLIFAIQESTHGYVGFHLEDVMIDCPKCHEIISTSSKDEGHLANTKKTEKNATIEDIDLPF